MQTFTSYDGTRLAYHERGEGEPLVVLPGGPMCASSYLGDLGGLSAHRRLILLDLRGTGDSATPEDPATYRCDFLVADVEALRAHLGLDRIDLLAHSAGGSLAMLYAARHPERVARLALIATTPWALDMPATPEHRLEAALLRENEPWFDEAIGPFRAWLDGTAGFDPVFLPFFHGHWNDATRDHTARGEHETNEAAADVCMAPGAFDAPATRAALATCPARVLVLAGELDGGPRPDLARRLADVFPHAETAVQQGAAHYPWLDDPRRFVRRVAAFLADD